VSSEVQLDHDRKSRTGLAEAVFTEGKSLGQLKEICREIMTLEKPMLFTRMSADTHESLALEFPDLLDYVAISKTASYGQMASQETLGPVAIVTGGSSDVPVAREASETLRFYGIPVTEIDDVGVAGLWRMQARLEELRQCPIVICVAGMDAALPTVLGGLIPSMLIAVPSSVGYGMAKEGETALRSLLVSCAQGIVVVNIDNGFGAACAAVRALNQFKKN